jgi:hypothetical protein
MLHQISRVGLGWGQSWTPIHNSIRIVALKTSTNLIPALFKISKRRNWRDLIPEGEARRGCARHGADEGKGRQKRASQVPPKPDAKSDHELLTEALRLAHALDVVAADRDRRDMTGQRERLLPGRAVKRPTNERELADFVVQADAVGVDIMVDLVNVTLDLAAGGRRVTGQGARR